MFRGWIRMQSACPHCGFRFEREPGFYLGSIYFNYGLTAVLVTVAYLGLFLGADVSPDVLLWPLFGFCLLFPLWFFRYARSLWLGFDQYFDPQPVSPARPAAADHQPGEDRTGEEESSEQEKSASAEPTDS